MNQQVNLYRPLFRRQRHVLSGMALLQSLGVAVVGLMALYAYGAWQVATLETQVAALDAQRAAAEQRLLDLEKQMPKREPSRILAAELARVSSDVDARQALVSALRNGVLGERRGFAEFLEGLSRQRVDGLWLTGLAITSGGRQLALNGSALEPALVPKLVKQLGDEVPFTGYRFNSLVIADRADEHAWVDFLIRTGADESKD